VKGTYTAKLAEQSGPFKIEPGKAEFKVE